jgi:hypothetical protein
VGAFILKLPPSQRAAKAESPMAHISGNRACNRSSGTTQTNKTSVCRDGGPASHPYFGEPVNTRSRLARFPLASRHNHDGVAGCARISGCTGVASMGELALSV